MVFCSTVVMLFNQGNCAIGLNSGRFYNCVKSILEWESGMGKLFVHLSLCGQRTCFSFVKCSRRKDFISQGKQRPSHRMGEAHANQDCDIFMNKLQVIKC